MSGNRANLPHNPEAEAAVLGCVLLRQRTLDRLGTPVDTVTIEHMRSSCSRARIPRPGRRAESVQSERVKSPARRFLLARNRMARCHGSGDFDTTHGLVVGSSRSRHPASVHEGSDAPDWDKILRDDSIPSQIHLASRVVDSAARTSIPCEGRQASSWRSSRRTQEARAGRTANHPQPPQQQDERWPSRCFCNGVGLEENVTKPRPSGRKLSQARLPDQAPVCLKIDNQEPFVASTIHGSTSPCSARRVPIGQPAGVPRGHGYQARHRRAEDSIARSATRADNALDCGLAAWRPLSRHDGPLEVQRACMRAFQANRNDIADRTRSLRSRTDMDGEKHGGSNHG